MLQSQLGRQRFFDTLGGFLSLGCSIHCLLVPVLTVFWPVLGATFFAHDSFHTILLYFVIPTALISLGLGYRHHGHHQALFIGVIGLGILTILTLTEEKECLHCVAEAGLAGLAVWNWSPEVMLQKGGMIIGSLLLCSAHWKNFTTCKKADCSY